MKQNDDYEAPLDADFDRLMEERPNGKLSGKELCDLNKQMRCPDEIYNQFRNIPMSHENPASIVPGSMHVNRAGERVFIECVKLQSPWTDPRRDPVHGVCEKDRNLRAYQLSGQYFESKQSELDLIREYKEPQSYGGYLVVNIEGRLVTIRGTLDKALEDIRIWTKFSKEKYKIIRVSGSEEVEVPS